MSTESVSPVAYAVPEAARALSVSRDTIYQLIRSGRLRTIKVGRRRLVPAMSLDEYVVAELRGVS